METESEKARTKVPRALWSDQNIAYLKTSRYAACGAALGVASCGVNDDGRTDRQTEEEDGIALPVLRPALLGHSKKY